MACRGSRLHASRPTRGQGGLSRTPWLLAIVLLSLWQCLPSHGLTWLQLLSTIRALIGGCIDRSPGTLTLHVSIGVSICRHMRAAFGLWLAQRSTRWLFPEAPPDLINFSMAQKHRFFDPPKIRPDPKSLALGPLGDTTQGLETKLEPKWSRKGAISPPVL